MGIFCVYFLDNNDHSSQEGYYKKLIWFKLCSPQCGKIVIEFCVIIHQTFEYFEQRNIFSLLFASNFNWNYYWKFDVLLGTSSVSSLDVYRQNISESDSLVRGNVNVTDMAAPDKSWNWLFISNYSWHQCTHEILDTVTVQSDIKLIHQGKLYHSDTNILQL